MGYITKSCCLFLEMSHLIPTLGGEERKIEVKVPKKGQQISKMISDKIFLDTEFDLDYLVHKIPSKSAVSEKCK